ncbi:MAG: PKD domain-containing protein [Oligoflexia bacterium]|nr:PKD domain-containing protein [Oligoflexia bacterium]
MRFARATLILLICIVVGFSPVKSAAQTVAVTSSNAKVVNNKKGLWCYRAPNNARRIGKLQPDELHIRLLSSKYQSLKALQRLIHNSSGTKRAYYKLLYLALRACLKTAFNSPTPTPTSTPTATPTNTGNLAPHAAIAGNPLEVLGAAITFSGSSSSDPEGAPLSYSWSLVQRPATSSATLTAATSQNVSVIPDRAGSYVVQLVVSDGQSQSSAEQITFQAVPGFHVGAGRPYTTPSSVSNLVQDGDTVLIDAGNYPSDVARWARNNLTLIGLGGYAHLQANGQAYGGKAIWVIQGSNTTIKNIEFSGCSVIDNNGAGIRQEGPNLTVVNSYFHDNQEGILANDNPTSTIVVTNSTFLRNGYADGRAHNIYINHVAEFWLMFSNSSLANVGHNVKSRAYRNFILYNRIMDEANGSASYEIDLPNGGTSYIVGNSVQQGPATQNSIIISYAEEGASNPSQDLYVVNNTIVNDRPAGGTFIRNLAPISASVINNLFVGPGSLFNGLGTFTANASYANASSAGLRDSSAYDYTLLPSSPAINAAVNPGSGSGLPLTPTEEYVHPGASRTRPVLGALDQGAFEFTP